VELVEVGFSDQHNPLQIILPLQLDIALKQMHALEVVVFSIVVLLEREINAELIL